ncbi:MAG: potassium transporter TrkG, partial [Candidatus Nanopelagicales bacterium]
ASSDARPPAPAGAASQVTARTQANESRLARRSPARSITTSFAILCAVGTALLMLPAMTTARGSASLGTALFTAVSASCVTGLSVVDTATYWTGLGKVTILVLIQVGGFGIQALGTLWILLLNRRLGTTSRLAAQAETGVLTPGDVRRVLGLLAIITVTVESAIAVLLGIRLWVRYDMSWPQAAWEGVFHSVSAFNNAGFALASDSLSTYGDDPLILVPISIAVVIGGLGFLVVREIFGRTTGERSLRPHRAGPSMTADEVLARGRELARRSRYRLGGFHPERFGWANPVPLSLHTRLMLTGTAVLMVLGTLGFLVFEWANPGTLAAMPWWEKLNQAVFSGGITPRTAGFNTLDYAAVAPETRLLTDALMFVGAGSGSTGGGIKVTTLMVLAVAVRAEINGHRDVNVTDRRIAGSTVRVAIAVTMISAAAVGLGTMVMLRVTDLSLDHAMFEVTSALATVGLSANVTPGLPESGQLLLVVLMFLGRVGPLTLASSLTLRSTFRAYRLPEGRPMIG